MMYDYKAIIDHEFQSFLCGTSLNDYPTNQTKIEQQDLDREGYWCGLFNKTSGMCLGRGRMSRTRDALPKIHDLDGVDQMNPECPFRGRCIMKHQDGTPCQLNHSKHSTKYYPAQINCRNHSAVIGLAHLVHMFFDDIDRTGDGTNNDGAASA